MDVGACIVIVLKQPISDFAGTHPDATRSSGMFFHAE